MTVCHVYLYKNNNTQRYIGTLNHKGIAGNETRYKMRTLILRVNQQLNLFQLYESYQNYMADHSIPKYYLYTKCLVSSKECPCNNLM